MDPKRNSRAILIDRVGTMYGELGRHAHSFAAEVRALHASAEESHIALTSINTFSVEVSKLVKDMDAIHPQDVHILCRSSSKPSHYL